MSDTNDLNVFESTFQQCGIGLAHVSPEGHFIRVNQALSRFLGYTSDELIKLDFQHITHPDYLELDLQYVSELLDGIKDSYQMDKIYIHKQGSLVWGKLTVTLVRNEDGTPAFFISVVEDIDDKKRIETEFTETQETLRSIINSLSDRMAVWVAAPDFNQMIYVNEGYPRIWGRSSTELFENPRSFICHIHAADRQRVKDFYQNVIKEDWMFEYRIMRDDGDLRYIRERGVVIRNHEGVITNLVTTADDITHDKQLNEALKAANGKLDMLSRTDGLTGIDNRRESLRFLDAEFTRLGRISRVTTSTLAFLDLDKFKNINDEFGHLIGDKALICLVDHIKSSMRENDQVGRYGGDEFLLLLRDTDAESAQNVVDRIFAKPLVVNDENGNRISINCSVGLAQWHESMEDVQQWIEQADQHMYHVKGNGRA